MDSQSTEREHGENDELLRAPDLQLLDIRHRQDENNEVHDEVRGVGAHEEQSVVDAACDVFDTLVPVGWDGDAMQGDGDILVLMESVKKRATKGPNAHPPKKERCMPYPRDQPANHTHSQDPDGPSDAGDLKDAPVECEEG